MRSPIAVPETGLRERVVPAIAPEPSAVVLRLPAPFTRTPGPTIPIRPSSRDRRAGAERMQIRVLVAEDHPLVREGVMRALAHDSAIDVVGSADNGVTAMELALALKPDVMVLDLRMPGLGGAGVLARLRAELPDTKALVMTADESPESLVAAVEAGAAGYLSKGRRVRSCARRSSRPTAAARSSRRSSPATCCASSPVAPTASPRRCVRS
jgi:CheY-like chemotaxis protein